MLRKLQTWRICFLVVIFLIVVTYTYISSKGSHVVIPDLPVGRSRFDNQRILRIYDFHVTGLKWESLLDKYDVCFATQASIERIHWLPYLLEKWTAPLSIAVQITSEEEWLVLNLYMNYLTKCNPTFATNVAMHLAVPANLSALKVTDKILSQWKGLSLQGIVEEGETCPEAKTYLNYLLRTFSPKDKRKLKYKELYPQNHMRNIGRQGCGTYWTYNADVDTIPSNGMADKLQEFYIYLKTQGKLCSKCAYITPAFELKETAPFPETKAQISQQFRNGEARQYYVQIYSRTQGATNYTLWTSSKPEEKTVSISHALRQNELRGYEPFYLSPGNIPSFDERFLGYGFTRVSQFKSAVLSGWKFSVLTPVFSIHWGFQTSKTVQVAKKHGFGKAVRSEQIRNNRNIYDKFVKELEYQKEIGTI